MGGHANRVIASLPRDASFHARHARPIHGTVMVTAMYFLAPSSVREN